METTYLYRVSNNYYFRIRIPKDLKEWFGRSDFKRSLRTKSLTSARRLVKIWAAKTEKLFTTIRAGIMAGIMTAKQIKALVEEYIGYTLKLDDEQRLASGVPEEIVESEEGPIRVSERAEFDPEADIIKNELEENRFDAVSRRLDEFLVSKGVEIDKDSYEYKALCRDIAYAHIDTIHQINVDRDMGNFSDPYYRLDASAQDYHDGQNINTNSHAITQANNGRTLSFNKLIEMYVKERKVSNDISPKSLDEFQTRMVLFQELLGDPDVSTISRPQIVDCLEKALRVPARRKQLPEYRDKTLEELLALESVPNPLGVRTIRSHFSSLSTLLGYAENVGYIQKNPAKGLLPKDGRGDEEKRIPYDDIELQKLVDALAEQRKAKNLKPFRWFIPLVSLFSGLRVDEVCQLYKEDIREENGIWVFDVNDKDDKKVKTKNSKRIVPVHPQLIELGLIEYVENLKHERVWPELKKGSRGYSHNWTDWYGKLNREHITNDPRKVFHSLRKSFSNNLKQNLIHDTVLKELLGHDRQSLGMSVYSNRYVAEVLNGEILKLDYEVDFSSLKWTAEG